MPGSNVFAWATAYFATFSVTSGLFAIAGASMAMAGSPELIELLFQLSLGLGVAAGAALVLALGSLLYGLARRALHEPEDALADPAEG